MEFLADSFVSRNDDVLEEVDADDGSALEADVLPAGCIVEVDLAEDLVEEILDEQTACIDHVLDHVGMVEGCIGESFKGEHVAHPSDHGTAVDAERIVAGGGMLLLQGLDVDLAIGIVTAEAFLFAAFPVVGSLDRRFNVVWDCVVSVLGHLCEQAIAVHNDLAGFRFPDDRVLEGGVHPLRADDLDVVEVEEDVSLLVVGDVVFEEDGPLLEILHPVSEFHVEATVNTLVVHLVVEPLAVGHCSWPLVSTRFDGHVLALSESVVVVPGPVIGPHIRSCSCNTISAFWMQGCIVIESRMPILVRETSIRHCRDNIAAQIECVNPFPGDPPMC